MIGNVKTGASFLGCLSYDLEDKRELSDEQKAELSALDGLEHKDRAEVLAYHKCYGDKYELAAQFRDVSRLSKKVEKPVFHFSIRLAEGEKLSRSQLIEIGEACAREFEVDKNQYLIIQHKDTPEQHIHLVANRVGFDGKVASDSNDFKRMAALCRRLEKQYHLKEVLSPRRFLSKEERKLPRHDKRKEKLQADIRRTLKEVDNYPAFEKAMKALGYQVIKGRGIAFIDDKKVRTKGSEVGFSLAKIEKILATKRQLVVKQAEQKVYEVAIRQQWDKKKDLTPVQRLNRQTFIKARIDSTPAMPAIRQMTTLLTTLLQPLPNADHGAYELTQEGYENEQRKKKRKKKQTP